MKILRNAHGMSLPEMLLAVMIMALIGGAVFSVFSQGIRVSSAALKSRAYTDYDFLMEKLTTDLDNALSYSDKSFTGSANEMEFYAASSLKNADVAPPPDILVPSKLKYSFLRDKSAIVRDEDVFQKILNPDATRASYESTVAQAKDCSFEYFHYDPKTKDSSWTPSWSENCLPYAVKVNLNFSDNGLKPTRVIVLPGGGNCGA